MYIQKLLLLSLLCVIIICHYYHYFIIIIIVVSVTTIIIIIIIIIIHYQYCYYYCYCNYYIQYTYKPHQSCSEAQQRARMAVTKFLHVSDWEGKKGDLAVEKTSFVEIPFLATPYITLVSVHPARTRILKPVARCAGGLQPVTLVGIMKSAQSERAYNVDNALHTDHRKQPAV